VLPAVLGLACLAFLLGVSTRPEGFERPASTSQQLDAVAQQPWAVVTTDRAASRFVRSHGSKTVPLLLLAVLVAAVATSTGWSRRAMPAGGRRPVTITADPAAARAPPR
jgi:hypothetical protein